MKHRSHLKGKIAKNRTVRPPLKARQITMKRIRKANERARFQPQGLDKL